jgi:hypothetical protein
LSSAARVTVTAAPPKAAPAPEPAFAPLDDDDFTAGWDTPTTGHAATSAPATATAKPAGTRVCALVSQAPPAPPPRFRSGPRTLADHQFMSSRHHASAHSHTHKALIPLVYIVH